MAVATSARGAKHLKNQLGVHISDEIKPGRSHNGVDRSVVELVSGGGHRRKHELSISSLPTYRQCSFVTFSAFNLAMAQKSSFSYKPSALSTLFLIDATILIIISAKSSGLGN